MGDERSSSRKFNAAGLRAAYGRRSPVRARLRHLGFWILRRLGSARWRTGGGYIRFLPSPASRLEAADLSARVNCYLRGAGVPLVVDEPSSTTATPHEAPYMDPAFARPSSKRTGTNSRTGSSR